MYNYLTAPFPFKRGLGVEILTTAIVGIFIVVFLMVFQPFGTEDFQSPHRQLFLSGYGIIVALVFLLARYIPAAFFEEFFSDQVWTVGKHIVWTFAAFAAAISVCFFYWAWFFSEQYSLSNYWSFSRFGLAIGIFPIIALILIDYITLLRRFSINENIHIPVENFSDSNIKTVLKGENAGEELSLNLDNFLFASAHRNYVEVNYIDDGALTQKLLRISLVNLLTQLPQDVVTQCHRSFIVNKRQISRVTGNAQGYRLHLHSEDLSVPVSRLRGREILAAIRSE